MMPEPPFQVVAFGSQSLSKQLADAAWSIGAPVRVYNVDDKTKTGAARGDNEILKEAISLLAGIASVRAFVSLGRASPPGGLSAISRVIDSLVSAEPSCHDAIVVAPPPRGADIWSDKKLIAEYLASRAVPTPRTVPLNQLTPEGVSEAVKRARLTFPLVVKPTRLTSGVGVRLAMTSSDLWNASQDAARYGSPLIACDFIYGDEVTFDALCLGNRVTLYPLGVLPPTDLALTHVNSKIQVRGVAPRRQQFDDVILQVTHDLRIQGFFSLEAIVTSWSPLDWVVLEGATRVTNNLQLQDASSGRSAMTDVVRFIAGLEPEASVADEGGISIAIPTFEHAGERSVIQLARLPWVCQVQLQDMRNLPGSGDHRVRMTIKMLVNEVLNDQLATLREATGDTDLPRRVLAELDRVEVRTRGRAVGTCPACPIVDRRQV